MGLLKKLLPIAGAVAGSFVGMPQVGAALGGALAGSGGGGGALSAGGGLLAAGLTKEQAQKSIEDYNKAQEGSVAAYTGARDASLGYYKPYAEGGQQGFQNALAMQTPGFQYKPTDPSYAFRVGEGVKALDRSGSARGTTYSGGQLKALTRYGQDYGSTEFQNDFARDNELARFGLDAAQGMTGAQDRYAGGIYNSLFSGARGRDPARIAKGQAASDQVGAGVDLVGSLFGSGGLFGGGSGGGGLSGFQNTQGFNDIATAFGF